MSSRLMTMKFMRRAEASHSSAPATPTGPPPTKRQRLSNGVSVTSPATPLQPDANSELLTPDEQRRSDALEREAADRGETKWYLSVQEPPTTLPGTNSPLNIFSAGYSTLDAPPTTGIALEDDGEDTVTSRPPVPGRRSFGKFNRTLEKRQNPEISSSESGSEEGEPKSEEGEEDDDPTGTGAFLRQMRKEVDEKAKAERRAKRKAEKVEALRLAEERRRKPVKLNKLSSISAAGGSPGLKDVTCHRCGQKGHVQRNCPQPAEDRRKTR